MKLNELVCPTCGLKCMTSASYTTCASCQTLFYANQSRSVDNPVPLAPAITINPSTIQPLIGPIDWAPWIIIPNDPNITGSITVTTSDIGDSGLRLTNAL